MNPKEAKLVSAAEGWRFLPCEKSQKDNAASGVNDLWLQLAYFDDIMPETILDHLLDNALRHSYQDSIIEVEWIDNKDQVVIEVRNNGEALEDCESIFKLDVSDPANGWSSKTRAICSEDVLIRSEEVYFSRK